MKPMFVHAVVAVALLASGPRPAEAQPGAPMKVVTKSLARSSAQKECFSLQEKQKLYYRFRADGPLDFKLQHNEEKNAGIEVKRDGIDTTAGSFTSKAIGDYCLVWTNVGKRAVTLNYEFVRGAS
jgi:hypothetical protein